MICECGDVDGDGDSLDDGGSQFLQTERTNAKGNDV